MAKRSKEEYSVEKVAQALRQAAGIRSGAALLLGCSGRTVGVYVNKYPVLQELEDEISELHLDMAETQLLKAMRAGSLTANIFYLKTKGKKRGYSEKEATDKTFVPTLVAYMPQTVDEDALAAAQEQQRSDPALTPAIEAAFSVDEG